MTTLTLLLALLCVSFSGCVTGTDGKQHVGLTDKQKAALAHLGNDELDVGGSAFASALANAAVNAASQGVSGQPFNSGQLASAAILGGFNGAAAGIRTLEGTKTPPTIQQVTTAIASSTGNADMSKVLAPGVAGAVALAVAKGAPVNQALETAAVQMELQGI
jgi:hypothetical protein